MKNISLSKLIVTVMGISAAQLYAYKFTVYNHLNVPINVEVPLLAAPGKMQQIAVPARGTNVADVNAWNFALHCFDTPSMRIAKEGGPFVVVPIKVARNQELGRMVEEARRNNGKVNTISGTDFNLALCKNVTIEVIEDTKGNIVAVTGPL